MTVFFLHEHSQKPAILPKMVPKTVATWAYEGVFAHVPNGILLLVPSEYLVDGVTVFFLHEHSQKPAILPKMVPKTVATWAYEGVFAHVPNGILLLVPSEYLVDGVTVFFLHEHSQKRAILPQILGKVLPKSLIIPAKEW
ncbi:MAG: hypothetical protein MJY71_03195 [Bacteroidaceae bacterium]|nr:hypothetical protein [Bacteroidaceae bacterium]